MTAPPDREPDAPPPKGGAVMLHGRGAEIAAIQALLDKARDGGSAAVVLRGEAGIGKSALLDHVASAAEADFRVLRSAGVETEVRWPFAGLDLLLRQSATAVDSLPDAQARALRRAAGREQPGELGADDRLQVGMAVLTLLADLADDRPLLCLIDDAHWLDRESAEALLFAGRRLVAEGVVLIFAARDGYAPEFPAPGVDALPLPPLDEAACLALLAEHAADLTEQDRAKILREARGNPLALRELPAARCEGESEAHDRPAPSQSTYGRLRQTFAERIAALPEATRTLIITAASDACGGAGIVFAAARRLGATVADLEPAERDGLLRLVNGRLVFGHPLMRSAAYRAAPPHRRMEAHRQLAEALGPDGNDCLRVWHLAAAAAGPDEEIAAALEQIAEENRSRGGHAAAAATYESAADHSPSLKSRARRRVAAAESASVSGDMAKAVELAELAARDLSDAA
ncbi:MAG: AAA family ATPase, partial [Stackebrandtia sp.]